MITDSIAAYLTSIRNALQARHRFLEVPSSRMRKEITRVLNEQGYLGEYSFRDNEGPQGVIRIALKYDASKLPVIRYIKRISKPSRRRYVKVAEIPDILNGFGVAILSTSEGIMTGKEARRRRLGGEEICHVY